MIPVVRKLSGDTRGAAAIEFALILFPLLLLVLGAIEFGRALWAREAIQSAATEGARCMGVRQSFCAPSGTYSAAATVTHIQDKAGELSVSVPASAITLQPNTTCAGVGGFSRVAIAYRFQTLVPLVLTSLADGIEMNVEACFPNQSGAS